MRRNFSFVNKSNLEKWLIVIDGRGRIRSGYKGDEVNGHYMLHVTSNSVSPDYLNFMKNKNIPFIIAGDKQVDLERAMIKLKTKLGVKHLTTTSGGKLGGALLKNGLIDEIHIIFKPLLYSGFNTPSLFDSPDLKPDELPAELELLTATTQSNGHVWLRYKVLKSDV